MKIRNRIKELVRIPGSQLLANPANYRVHTEEQNHVLQGVLQQVGFAAAALAYYPSYDPENLLLLNGHARAALAGDDPIPVLVLDVTDEEANLILATHDTISELAGTNQELLDSLIGDLTFDNEGFEYLATLLRSPPDQSSLSIPGTGEHQASDESARFRGWRLSLDEATADLLAEKVSKYMDEFGTCFGLADRMIEAARVKE
jgi:hypothetical protein